MVGGPCASRDRSRGFSLAEMLIALSVAALLLAGLTGVVNRALGTDRIVTERNALQAEARFAMQRIVQSVSASSQLLLPLPDKADTTWRENVREQTVPASPPESGSSLATAVLAVALGSAVDLDRDGFADADNDQDGRINEDPPADITNDNAPGIYLVDDGGDGEADEGSANIADDDEWMDENDEDPINGIDDDGDGVVDEDPGSDANGDGAPGIRSVDDDQDGQIDEGSIDDDDEDGQVGEDWIDAVVFTLEGTALVERHPVPWDESGADGITGRDFITSTIAENVSRFRVERIAGSAHDAGMVSIVLELTGSSGQIVNVATELRVGGGL